MRSLWACSWERPLMVTAGVEKAMFCPSRVTTPARPARTHTARETCASSRRTAPKSPDRPQGTGDTFSNHSDTQTTCTRPAAPALASAGPALCPLPSAHPQRIWSDAGTGEGQSHMRPLQGLSNLNAVLHVSRTPPRPPGCASRCREQAGEALRGTERLWGPTSRSARLCL